MKTLFFCLLAGLLLQTADIGRACEYCRMAAEDPEAARLALAAHASSGAFPLQSTINQFKGDAPPAVLTAPPAASSVATSAADLPATRPSSPPAAPAKAPVVPSSARRAATAPPPVRPAGPTPGCSAFSAASAFSAGAPAGPPAPSLDRVFPRRLQSRRTRPRAAFPRRRGRARTARRAASADQLSRLRRLHRRLLPRAGRHRARHLPAHPAAPARRPPPGPARPAPLQKSGPHHGRHLQGSRGRPDRRTPAPPRRPQAARPDFRPGRRLSRADALPLGLLRAGTRADHRRAASRRRVHPDALPGGRHALGFLAAPGPAARDFRRHARVRRALAPASRRPAARRVFSTPPRTNPSRSSTPTVGAARRPSPPSAFPRSPTPICSWSPARCLTSTT